MRIAVPTEGNKGLDERVGRHFGRVPTYTLLDEESGEVTVLENTSEHMGGRGYPPEILGEAGVEVLLCSGLGRKAIHMFSERGIKVYCGASGTVRDALSQWRSDSLEPATEDTACTQHAFHGKGRHEH